MSAKSWVALLVFFFFFQNSNVSIQWAGEGEETNSECCGRKTAGPLWVQRVTGSPPASLTQFVMRTCYHCRLAFLASCVICSDGKTDCSQTRGGSEFPQPIYLSCRQTQGRLSAVKRGWAQCFPCCPLRLKRSSHKAVARRDRSWGLFILMFSGFLFCLFCLLCLFMSFTVWNTSG